MYSVWAESHQPSGTCSQHWMLWPGTGYVSPSPSSLCWLPTEVQVRFEVLCIAPSLGQIYMKKPKRLAVPCVEGPGIYIQSQKTPKPRLYSNIPQKPETITENVAFFLLCVRSTLFTLLPHAGDTEAEWKQFTVLTFSSLDKKKRENEPDVACLSFCLIHDLNALRCSGDAHNHRNCSEKSLACFVCCVADKRSVLSQNRLLKCPLDASITFTEVIHTTFAHVRFVIRKTLIGEETRSGRACWATPWSPIMFPRPEVFVCFCIGCCMAWVCGVSLGDIEHQCYKSVSIEAGEFTPAHPKSSVSQRLKK